MSDDSRQRPDRRTDIPVGDGERYSGHSRRQHESTARRRGALTPGIAAALAIAAFVVGLMLGWMARGGPPKSELVVQTQSVPAVTVTREVAP